MTETKPLRLLAEDAADLQVLSAALQDAVTKTANVKYVASKRRFSIEVNRFRWEAGAKQRVRSIIAFEDVLSVQSRGLAKGGDPETVISLLQVGFAPDAEPPGGIVTFLLAGDGEIALTVEALDATLLDSDYVWGTKHVPGHERRKR